MTAYVKQLGRSEKGVNLIEGSLQVFRLLLSYDQAHRGLTGSIGIGRLHKHLRCSLRAPPEALRLRLLFLQSIAPNRIDPNFDLRSAIFFAWGAVFGSTKLQFARAGKIQNREVSPFQCIVQAPLSPVPLVLIL